jgi:ABC transporter substrate binding protein
MTRRTIGWLILLALGTVCAPLAGAALPAERVSRIGFLAFGPPPPDPVPPAFPLTALREGLRELGYVEGHTVIVGATDPVAEGLVASLARPGGNVSGLAVLAGRDVEGKRLELLHAAVPTATRVGLVINLKTAQALGLVLPPTLLFLADEVTH